MEIQPEQQQILAATTGLACAYLPSINSGILGGPGATYSLLHSCQKFFCLLVKRLLWVSVVLHSLLLLLDLSSRMPGKWYVLFRNDWGLGWVDD